jgi:hypothetical protein
VENGSELHERKRKDMLEIDRMLQTALTKGFKHTSASKDGTTVWFSKPAGHSAEANRIMCIDFITRSGTVFWKNEDSSVDSKTFRNAESLISWLEHA